MKQKVAMLAALLAASPARAIVIDYGNVEFDPADCPNGSWQTADHQCLMKPPPPPENEPWTDTDGDGLKDPGEFEDWNGDGRWSEGDEWGRPENGGNGGWMVHYRWCLGQTRTVTDERYARRLTHIYADPAKDTWTLLPTADCNDPALRSLAGMPPIGAEIPREQENCVAFHGPAVLPADDEPESDPIVGFKVYMQPGSHHLIVWDVIHPCNETDGQACHSSFFPASGVNDWQSFVCEEIAGYFNRSVMSGSQRVESPVPFPDDDAREPDGTHRPLVGFHYGKRHYFLINHHIQRYPDWDPKRSIAGEAWINYYRAPLKPRNRAHVFLEGLTGDATILVPPYTVGHPQGVWFPPRWPAWVFHLSAHMHKRGLHFFTNKIPANPPEGTGHSHPDCTNTEGFPFLYKTSSWSEPTNCFYVKTSDNPDAEPIRFDVGEGLRYECITNNGVKATDDLPPEVRKQIEPYFSAREVKWACEEVPGVPPGIPFFFLGGRLVAPCAPDDPAAYPLGSPSRDSECVGKQGQLRPWPLTGRCVPANLIFGPSQDDEMCLLPGMYWMDEDGVPSGFPDASGPGFGG